MKLSRRTTALLLLFGPAALFIVSFLFFSVIGFTFDPNFLPDPDGLVTEPTPAWVLVAQNISLAIAFIGVVVLIPGIVAGIILYRKRRASL